MIQIQWLDLSFNKLQRLDENIISYFPNLTTLYLHSNQLSKLSHLKKLSGLSHLKSLTLYGNPLEENKHYRNYVLYLFPELQQLDFSVITAGQREQVTVDIIGLPYPTPTADVKLEPSLQKVTESRGLKLTRLLYICLYSRRRGGDRTRRRVRRQRKELVIP
jgi:Leucine-rich repeat (LRR) protein